MDLTLAAIGMFLTFILGFMFCLIVFTNSSDGSSEQASNAVSFTSPIRKVEETEDDPQVGSTYPLDDYSDLSFIVKYCDDDTLEGTIVIPNPDGMMFKSIQFPEDNTLMPTLVYGDEKNVCIKSYDLSEASILDGVWYIDHFDIQTK